MNASILEYLNIGMYKMPSRTLISQELASYLNAISHAHRIRIIEELYTGEKDVTSLSNLLEISHSSVSQHLSVLRAKKMVDQRKEGNRVFYRLVQPKLAKWLLEGIEFIEAGFQSQQLIRNASFQAKMLWGCDVSQPVK